MTLEAALKYVIVLAMLQDPEGKVYEYYPTIENDFEWWAVRLYTRRN